MAVAIRLARAVTGRDLVVKFEGHYHGWFDGFFASTGFDPGRSGPSVDRRRSRRPPGSRPQRWPTSSSPSGTTSARSRRSSADHPSRVAAIICEPVAVNGGLIPAEDGFLAALRRLATESGALLVFDEVITGFRVALGGAQERMGVRADLAVFAKAIAGGIALRR